MALRVAGPGSGRPEHGLVLSCCCRALCGCRSGEATAGVLSSSPRGTEPRGQERQRQAEGAGEEAQPYPLRKPLCNPSLPGTARIWWGPAETPSRCCRAGTPCSGSRRRERGGLSAGRRWGSETCSWDRQGERRGLPGTLPTVHGLLDPPSLQQPILRRFAPPDNLSPSFPVPEQGSAPPAAASSQQPRVSRCLGTTERAETCDSPGQPCPGSPRSGQRKGRVLPSPPAGHCCSGPRACWQRRNGPDGLRRGGLTAPEREPCRAGACLRALPTAAWAARCRGLRRWCTLQSSPSCEETGHAAVTARQRSAVSPGGGSPRAPARSP